MMLNKREMFFEIHSGRTRPIVEQAPLLSSAESPWSGVLLEHHSIESFEAVDISCVNHVAVMKLRQPASVEWKLNGHVERVDFCPGRVVFFPANFPHSSWCKNSGEFVTVSLEQEFLACATAELDGLNDLELTPQLAVEDPFVEATISALMREVEQGCPGGRLYGESLATSMAVHLAHRYSTPRQEKQDRRGGLAKFQLRAVIDFIKDRVGEDISLKQMASHVNISPYHFARMFKRSTGLSPHQYVMRYRVERAKQILLSPGTSIADVAAQLGFCDQSHLAAHFKRVYGVTPKRYLREKVCRTVYA